MAAGARAVGEGAGSRRCQCTHLPTDHMRVVPLGANADGNWRLEPSGPCERCGKEACPKFRPGPPRSPP